MWGEVFTQTGRYFGEEDDILLKIPKNIPIRLQFLHIFIIISMAYDKGQSPNSDF